MKTLNNTACCTGVETQFNEIPSEIGELRERMAHLGGLLEGLRPAPHRTRRPRTESRPAPRRPRRVALARAALACVLALAALATPALAQTTVPSGWSLTPTGLTAGAQFRLLFLSSTKRDGSVTDIATYNTFIQGLAAAGHTDIQAYSTGFRVVGCTAAVDARDNTSTTGTGVAIYWLNGAKVADNYADFYDGSWDDEANDNNESGTDGPDTSLAANYPITGCKHDGTELVSSLTSRSFALGSSEGPVVGRPNSSTTGHGPISTVSGTTFVGAGTTDTRPMYGLSAVFQVGADTTPPTLSSAEVIEGGVAIAVTFSENLKQSNLAPASAITVTADGIAVTVPVVTQLALAEALINVTPRIRQGQAVVVTYTDPTTGDDANAFQDIAGNDAATFTTGMNGVPAVTNGSTVAATAPGAPTGLTATASGTTTINLSWTAPADNGGRVITGYKIEVSSDSGATWTDRVADTSSTTTTYAHTGLAGATTRHYRVSAINTIGTGLPSNIDNATTTNNAPTVANAIPDQSAPVGTAFSYAFPANTFSDADSDALTYTATKADGTALPTWLSFTAGTRAFSGTPQAADTGTVSVKVTASDGNGGSVSDEFDITVSAADTTPPTLTSATVLAGGQIIELQLSENVQRSNLPPASAFTVTAGGSAVTLSLVLVPAALDTYWISVPSSSVIRQGQVVVVTYTDPSTGDDANAIQDVAGNDAATFTTGMNSVPAVTNNSTVNTPATGAPTITGTPQVGQTLTAVTTAIMDANGLNNVSYTYQWIRVDGTDADILGATASTYTLVAADQGKTIKVKVSFTDDASNPETRTSVATAVVSAASNTPATGAPTITGTPQVGQTLTAVTTAIMDANGLNNVSYTYQWIRVDGSDSDISGATASTYTLVDDDQGKTIKVKVSFTDDANNPETLTSVATAVVSASSDTLPPRVSIRDRSIREDIGTAVLTVTLSGPGQVSLSIPWSTSELDAVSPDDYTDGLGVLTFAPGATEATISIPIVDDDVREAAVESFSVVLGPGEGYRFEINNTALVHVLDNDGVGLVPSRATVNGTTLVLTYDEVLDSASTPYPFHFYVTVDDNRVDAVDELLGVDQVSVGGSMVTLTLATAVQASQTVRLDYVSGVGQNQIQDGEGNAAMSFTDWLVTNITGGGTLLTLPRPPRPPGPVGPRTSAPGSPRNLTAAGGNGEVVLTWEAPENDGGFAITDYEVRINGRGSWISTGSIHTTHTVTGLTNGTAYVFEVRAVNRIGRSRASNRAEATPIAPEVFTLDFAHFANGTGITSEMVLVNVATHPIRPAIYFYDQQGHLIDHDSVVDITGDLEVAEDGSLSVLTEMEPLGVLTISTHGRGELVSGSVRVVSDGPLGGGLRYNLPAIGEAVVGASPPVRDVLFPARRQEGGIRTAAALHNLGAEAMGVSCRLMSGGVALEEAEIHLEANGQASWFIEEAFPTTDTSDFLGSVRCTVFGSRRFTAIAVEIDAGKRIFTTLPVVPVDRGGGGREAVLDFAHFANGTGITSDFVFVNLSTQPSGPPLTPFHSAIPSSRPAMYFYDTEGALVSAESVVDVTGDLEITEDGALTVRTQMEPLGVLTISTHGRGALVTGSVKVVSDGPIGAALRFDLPHIGEAVVGASPPVSDAIFPVRRQEGGINTGVALHNLESSAGLVRCDLMREGVLLDAVSIPLEANGQTSWLIDQAFPNADTSDFVGSLRCDAVGEDLFTALALEMDPATRTFITLPVVPVPERASQE